jgi:hypothetical protein
MRYEVREVKVGWIVYDVELFKVASVEVYKTEAHAQRLADRLNQPPLKWVSCE